VVRTSKNNKRLRILGTHIKSLRRSQNISQAQLAFESKLTRLQIGRIERGEINCGITNLFDIADALDIDPKELLNFKLTIKKSI